MPNTVINALEHPIFSRCEPRLAAALRALLHQHVPHRLDTIKFGEVPPAGSLTLAEWSRPAVFHALVRRYSDERYREHPNSAREEKPLQSLWSQWYLGLLVPPLMLALLMHSVAPDFAPENIYVEFHHTGRAAAFYIVTQPMTDAPVSRHERLETLLTQCITPVVTTLNEFGVLNAKLIWNNTGYLMHWFLGTIAALLPADEIIHLKNELFFSRTLLDGRENPLYRTVIPRGGVIQRRSCCQRYRIPGVEKCPSCTLNTV
ncbi:siderophore-iron reductase FhuF [Brenneria rubrifaciens]|uniref:Hydroxamate siderophore iron reductase FhuF n=1 Tax=Brenneria rubrifaciens TaxID=55213 RepID=A0A4P8QKZ2_9GAMM|nr:siderophore-iron reductase FhuF [Brenneria rubrifaciens]QCR07527.1 hydroxamate siderophore iron reductase FhuF [Brenneria rubrifaciens]